MSGNGEDDGALNDGGALDDENEFLRSTVQELEVRCERLAAQLDAREADAREARAAALAEHMRATEAVGAAATRMRRLDALEAALLDFTVEVGMRDSDAFSFEAERARAAAAAGGDLLSAFDAVRVSVRGALAARDERAAGAAAARVAAEAAHEAAFRATASAAEAEHRTAEAANLAAAAAEAAGARLRVELQSAVDAARAAEAASEARAKQLAARVRELSNTVTVLQRNVSAGLKVSEELEAAHLRVMEVEEASKSVEARATFATNKADTRMRLAESETARLRAAHARVVADSSELRAEVAALKVELASFRANHGVKVQEAAVSRAAALEARSRAAAEEVEDLRRTVARLKSLLAERDGALAAMKTERAALCATVASFRAEPEYTVPTPEAARAAVEGSSVHYAAYWKAKLKERDEQVTALNASLKRALVANTRLKTVIRGMEAYRIKMVARMRETGRAVAGSRPGSPQQVTCMPAPRRAVPCCGFHTHAHRSSSCSWRRHHLALISGAVGKTRTMLVAAAPRLVLQLCVRWASARAVPRSWARRGVRTLWHQQQQQQQQQQQ